MVTCYYLRVDEKWHICIIVSTGYKGWAQVIYWELSRLWGRQLMKVAKAFDSLWRGLGEDLTEGKLTIGKYVNGQVKLSILYFYWTILHNLYNFSPLVLRLFGGRNRLKNWSRIGDLRMESKGQVEVRK